MTKFQFLLFSVLGVCLSAVPADASQLSYWKFNPNKNRLDFRTDTGVQPIAIMLFSPTRLVIDLPGISFPRPTSTQNLTGTFRWLRVGQLDARTTRLVLQLQPGYTLNPKQIQFTGESPKEWYVTIPPTERGAALPTLAPRANLPR